MTEESRLTLRASKIANIILQISEIYHVSMQKATDIYYKSKISELIEEGVADLQCRSNGYLATLIWEEYKEMCTE